MEILERGIECMDVKVALNSKFEFGFRWRSVSDGGSWIQERDRWRKEGEYLGMVPIRKM